jgi:shikimate kinase
VTRIRAVALTVWLRARLDTLLSRLGSRERIERPLLGGAEDGEARLAEFLAARAPWYGHAHLTIDTDALDVDQVVARVIAGIEARAHRPSEGGGAWPCA